MNKTIPIVNFLEKSRLITLKCLMFIWVTYWMSLVCNQLTFILRFYDPLNPHLSNSSVLELGRLSFIVITSIILGWKFFIGKDKRREIDYSLSDHSQQKILLFSLCKIAIILFCILWFVVMSLFFLSCSMDHMIEPLAGIAEYFKNYELAERIYKQQEYKQADLSFSTWHTLIVPEDEPVRYARSAAVAKIYGDKSLEMIERYLYVGENLNLGLEGDYPEQSLYWFQKCFDLANSLSISDKAFCALYNTALVKYDQELFSEERRLIEQARLKLDDNLDVSRFGRHRLYDFWISLEVASGMAHQLGDLESEKAFAEQLKKVNAQLALINQKYVIKPSVAVFEIYGSLLLALALTVVPLEAWLLKILLQIIHILKGKRSSRRIDLRLNPNFLLIISRKNLGQELLPNVHATVFILFFLAFFWI